MRFLLINKSVVSKFSGENFKQAVDYFVIIYIHKFLFPFDAYFTIFLATTQIFSVFDISLFLHGQQCVLNNLCEATNLTSWVFISKLLTAINISLILYLLFFIVLGKKAMPPFE